LREEPKQEAKIFLYLIFFLNLDLSIFFDLGFILPILRTCSQRSLCSTRGPGAACDQHGRQGPWVDNVFTERPWKSVKYENIRLKAYGSMAGVKKGLATYFMLYNERRWHQNFGRKDPGYDLLQHLTAETG
jgi:Integrase core domain